MADPRHRPVGVGILGCGWIADIAHVPTLGRTNAGRLVAAADADPSREAWLRERVPGARFHADWDTLLADPSVDAVIVALPTALHADAACRAFAAGKHVFLEKPLAVTLEDGRRVVDAWRLARTVGAIGYNFRRNPIFRAACRTHASGTLGPLVAIQGRFHWAANRIAGWRAHPEDGGGVLLDLVSHHADLVAALTGQRATAVQCTLQSVRSADDTAAVQFVVGDGVIAQLQASFAVGAQVNRLDLVGHRGALAVDLLDPRPRRVTRVPGRFARLSGALAALDALHPTRLFRPPGREPSFHATLEAFLEAVRRGEQATPDLSDGLHALAVIEAATASARSGGGMVAVELD